MAANVWWYSAHEQGNSFTHLICLGTQLHVATPAGDTIASEKMIQTGSGLTDKWR